MTIQEKIDAAKTEIALAQSKLETLESDLSDAAPHLSAIAALESFKDALSGRCA